MNVYQFVFVHFPFGFEGGMWDLIVLIPDHCLSIYFVLIPDHCLFIYFVLIADLFTFYFQACLSCSNVACGRFNEKHALLHYTESKVRSTVNISERAGLEKPTHLP